MFRNKILLEHLCFRVFFYESISNRVIIKALSNFYLKKFNFKLLLYYSKAIYQLSSNDSYYFAQISLICKLGSHNYENMKSFSIRVEDALFRLGAHSDNIHINYKMEAVQISAVDELYVEQNTYGSNTKQIARVRLFFLGFLTG